MRFKGVALITVVISMLMSVSLFAQEGMDGGEEAAMMQAWQNYMTPSEGHEMLAKGVGEWKTTTKFWMDPEQEPQVSEGTATAELILGGRYLKMKHEGMVMGMPFEGYSIEGYDNGKGAYESIWIDNMGSGITKAVGNYDADTKEVVMKGMMYDPMAGKDVEYKMVLKHTGNDSYTMSMYAQGPGGSEFKTMEMTYTRVK